MTARGITDVEWPIVGKPKKIGVDNAGEFHSQAFERGCAQHGIEIDWRPPGQPQFGGILERVIGTLVRRIHKLPGTPFSNTAQRGTYDSEGRACLTRAASARHCQRNGRRAVADGCDFVMPSV